MRECDEESADYLAIAFEDAMKFYGYKVNVKGLRHFRSLDNYLSKVGTDKAFEELRYWAIGESSKDETGLPYISPPIHRELLCALMWALQGNSRETVSDRVDSEVASAMFSRRHISYGTDDTCKEQSVLLYISWLKSHPTYRSALEEAVLRNLGVLDNAFVLQTLRDAYEDLRQSEDPAVRHYIGTLSYLPKGSQQRNADAIPDVKWYGQNQISGGVETPSGTPLGHIQKCADGSWAITTLGRRHGSGDGHCQNSGRCQTLPGESSH